MTYQDKLKDVRWQKKRLEILNRDDWQCQSCFDRKSTLTVHHKEYISGREPWEYDKELITLCEDCHANIHLWEKGEQYMPPWWLLCENITDWFFLIKRLEQLQILEGYNGIKTAIQLLTSYVITEKEI